MTLDDNANNSPILISDDGNSMLIDYSSFTCATLIGRLNKDTETRLFKS